MDSKPKAYSQRVKRVEVPADRDGQRLDNFLARYLKDLPRGALYRLIRTGQVRVNGGRSKPERKLSSGDEVRIPPVEVRETGDITVSDAICEQITAAITYEDGDLLVVNKPSGIAVHGGSGLAWGLVDVVRQIRPNQGIELVHRIDRETSGCLVLAKNGEALRTLGDQFRQGTVIKRYLCLMDGLLKEDSVSIDAPIAESRKGGEKFMKVDPGGREALTRFKTLQKFESATYAQASIETGRTHQIRVHARHLGAPLAGDRRYAGKESIRRWKDLGLKRLFLHSSELELNGPSGAPLTFSAPLPDELRQCLDQL